MASRKHNKDNIPGSSYDKTEPPQKRFRSKILEAEIINKKVFNDPIHGSIELHPLCVMIIDTPQFQRLRSLKQLGACYFVYPGATHNRFEHSIGVCHLAGRLVRALQERQTGLKITDKDVMCVEIAALCHDLGHGPFCHLFQDKFIPRFCPGEKWKKLNSSHRFGKRLVVRVQKSCGNRRGMVLQHPVGDGHTVNADYYSQHEDASWDMFRYMIEEPDLDAAFTQYGLDDKDIVFIQEQMTGEKVPGPYGPGRSQQEFLYEIVANKRNGIDVDKWEYFARDCYMLGIKNNFDHNRCIHFARVLKVDGQLQICYRDKEEDNLYDMFHTRMTLHRRAYQHLVVNVIETMITEALVKANPYLLFAVKDGDVGLRMSDAIHDMEAYSQMTDNVFQQILNSGQPELQESREILENIMRRKLYKYVGQTLLKLSSDLAIPRSRTSIVEEGIYNKLSEDDQAVLKDKIVVILVCLDYGMKDKNPIDSVRFYSKEDPDVFIKARKDLESMTKPQNFSEQQLRVFCKDRTPKSLRSVKRAFDEYCNDMG